MPGSVVRAQSGDINIASQDTSDIFADVAASALGVSIDLGNNKTRSITVGLSISRNEIRNDMAAYIRNAGDSTNAVETKAGNIVITADEAANIDSSSVASAIGVAASLNADSLAFSAGGASAVNVILGKSNAYLENANVKASGAGTGRVELGATNSSIIDSTVAATVVSVALSGGSDAKAFAIGFSFAGNMIGWSDLGTEERLEVKAYAASRVPA